MTSSPDQSNADDQPKTEPAPRKPLQANVVATLLDADGQSLSKGTANLYSDNRPTFRPTDEANQDTIRTRAKILFLTDTKESLAIAEVVDCPSPGTQPLH